MKNRIPKIIHYCWFGTSKLSNLEIGCISSWKALFPEYKFKLWNENSLDLKQYPFAFKAFEIGRYAFVSDVVRLHALYHEGGIYLDTDMLVIKKFDLFLDNNFFTGEYRKGKLNAAVIGAKAGHPLLFQLLEFYRSIEFDHLKPKTIPEVFDEVVWDSIHNSIKIYPPEFFYPLPLENKDEDYSSYISENSYAIHLWNHSWKDEFALLREDRFLSSIFLAFRHILCYPTNYLNKNYWKRYSIQFKIHFKRYLKINLLKRLN